MGEGIEGKRQRQYTPNEEKSMNKHMLENAIDLARRLQTIFVATSDSQGLPHLAAAGRLEPAGDDRLSVSAWFCPGTVSNLEANPGISLVVWDAASDTGYQVLGAVERVRDLAVMNGYIPGEEKGPPPPQVERELLVRIERIIAFSRAPHSDLEE